MKLDKNSVVTVDLTKSASNTFLVEVDEGETVLVTHPLLSNIFLRVEKGKVNRVQPNIKDSTERGIDYANNNRKYLDYNTIKDLEGVGTLFALNRSLTGRQKQILASICGLVAQAKLNNDVKEAMELISKNASLLDDFNAMWYNNFKNTLFSGYRNFTSKKQRMAIFNIAGYILAELENPTTRTRK